MWIRHLCCNTQCYEYKITNNRLYLFFLRAIGIFCTKVGNLKALWIDSFKLKANCYGKVYEIFLALNILNILKHTPWAGVLKVVYCTFAT